MSGLGNQSVANLPLHCRDCGSQGQIHMRPLVPRWGEASRGVTVQKRKRPHRRGHVRGGGAARIVARNLARAGRFSSAAT